MYPDFYCIGGQKCGSGWLYRNLTLASSQIWLPPMKEIHYFDERFVPDQVQQQLRDVTRPVQLRYRRWNREMRLIGSVIKRTPRFGTLAWLSRYYLLPRSDRWYAGLFSPAPGQLCGDITPAYSILDPAAVAHVHQLNPAAKAFFVVRDPVERAWSAIKMAMRHSGRLQELRYAPLDVVQEFLGRPSFLYRSNYPQTIENWESVFGSEQFRVWLFDDLTRQPDQLLREICEFLGVRQDGVLPKSIAEKANSDPTQQPMPEAVKAVLLEHFRTDLEILGARFGSAIASWSAID